MSFMMTGADMATGLAVALLTGAILGSLAAAIAWRLPRGEDWIVGRSRCPACSTVLSATDLVPILSWLVLRGRCRHCECRISARYPAVEAATALAFAAPILANGGFWLDLLPLWLLATTLMVLTLVDLSHRYIPDGTTAIIGLTGLALSLAGLSVAWTDALAASLLLGGSTWLVRWLASHVTGREAMGLGDVKLFAAAGLWLGTAGIAPLLLASAIAGLVFRLVRQQRGTDPEIPFGPCIAWTLYALLVGPLSSG